METWKATRCLCWGKLQRWSHLEHQISRGVPSEMHKDGELSSPSCCAHDAVCGSAKQVPSSTEAVQGTRGTVFGGTNQLALITYFLGWKEMWLWCWQTWENTLFYGALVHQKIVTRAWASQEHRTGYPCSSESKQFTCACPFSRSFPFSLCIQCVLHLIRPF